MFTVCREKRFRCLVSSVVSFYLFLNTFVYATEIFPRVFCCGGDQARHQQDEIIKLTALEDSSLSTPTPVSGSHYQPTVKCNHDDYCPDCKSSYGHHLMALSPFPISSQPDLATREFETEIFMLSEYQDSLSPPPPKPLL